MAFMTQTEVTFATVVGKPRREKSQTKKGRSAASKSSKKWGSNIEADFEVTNEKLGNGAFGIVFSGYDRRTGNKVAVKSIDKSRLKKPMELEREAAVLKHVSDPRYVCSLLGAYDTTNFFYIVLEFCGGGDFDKRIRNMLTQRGSPITEIEMLPWVAQMFASVAFMHERLVIHRDIKPANFLVQRHKSSKLEYLKLADFGLAVEHEAGRLMYGGGGTPVYMSPERHAGKGYSFNADVFSCGCIFAQLLNRGRHPYYDFKKKVFHKTKLMQAEIPEFATKSLFFRSHSKTPARSKSAIFFLKQTLNPNPSERLSAEKCLYHRWFDSVSKSISCSF